MGIDYKYVYGRGRSALNLSESEIRYAIENTKSNSEAARFLKVSFTTYKKYAKQYTDTKSGKTLWELHKNQSGSNKKIKLEKEEYILLHESEIVMVSV